MCPDVPGKTSSRKKGPPRPDELTRDAFEFISAIDRYKRDEMRSFLQLEQVLGILQELGYGRRSEDLSLELAQISEAIEEYKQEHERLFPNWSEIFSVLVQMGYRRAET